MMDVDIRKLLKCPWCDVVWYISDDPVDYNYVYDPAWAARNNVDVDEEMYIESKMHRVVCPDCKGWED